MGRAMLSKSLIQFSVDGWGCVPSLLFTWDQTTVEVIMATPFKRSHACTVTLSAPRPCSRPPLTHVSSGDSWTLPGKSGSVFCPFLLGPGGHRFCSCPPRVYFPVLCNFWQLYGGVNGDLLQEGLCHTQVCCTQPYPSGGKCTDQIGLKSWWFQTFNPEPDKFLKSWVCGMEHEREVPFSLP